MERIQQLTILILWFTTFQIAHSLLAPEPLPFNGLNRLLDARSIGIPAASPLSKRKLDWDDAMAKGDRLLCRMQNPALLNDQSTVTSLDMLAANGWTRRIESISDSVFRFLKPFFIQQEVWTKRRDFQAVTWEHTESSTNSQGQHVPMTGARFVNIFNAKAGILIAYHNFGPAWMVEGRPIKILPDIRAWSDVIFLEWQTQTQASGRDVRQLKYVVRYEIVNSDTITIIEDAAGDELINSPWPGLIEDMTDQRGRAILGTPNGQGIGYLLATHKAQFGQMTVKNVRTWWWLNEEGYVFAIFEIGPVTSPEPTTTN